MVIGIGHFVPLERGAFTHICEFFTLNVCKGGDVMVLLIPLERGAKSTMDRWFRYRRAHYNT